MLNDIVYVMSVRNSSAKKLSLTLCNSWKEGLVIYVVLNKGCLLVLDLLLHLMLVHQIKHSSEIVCDMRIWLRGLICDELLLLLIMP